MEIYKEFAIEAAHLLPDAPPGHKCRRLHGHSFRIQVHIAAELEPETGWVMDFAELEVCFKPIFSALDHRYLNEIKGLENPTSENLACWIWRKLRPALPQLTKIIVKETCSAGCIYRGK